MKAIAKKSSKKSTSVKSTVSKLSPKVRSAIKKLSPKVIKYLRKLDSKKLTPKQKARTLAFIQIFTDPINKEKTQEDLATILTIANNETKQLTKDDTFVQVLVDAGKLDRDA